MHVRTLAIVGLASCLLFVAAAHPAEKYVNIILNPSAENGKVTPTYWGMYLGAGKCVWGITDREAHTGKRSAFLQVTEYHLHKQGKKTISAALIAGASNGYTGQSAYPAKPDTWYGFSFWVKGDVKWMDTIVLGFKTEEATGKDRQTIWPTLGRVRPTGAWTKYSGSFLTRKDTRKFVLQFHVLGTSQDEVRLGTVYVDDVLLYEEPDPKKLLEVKVSEGFKAIQPVFVNTAGKKSDRAVRNFCVGQGILLQDKRLMMAYTPGGSVDQSFSADGGATWTEPKPIVRRHDEIKAMGKPAVVQSRNGTLWVFYYGWVRYHKDPKIAKSDLWEIHSKDNGKTWSIPKMIWKGYTGMLQGAIETRDGNLLVPFCYASTLPKFEGRFLAACVVSTDRDRTWQCREIDLGKACETSHLGWSYGKRGAGEPSVVELKDGRIWMLMRTFTGYLWESFSKDGGLTWSKPAQTKISCGGPVYVGRFMSGRLVLVWNEAGWNNLRRRSCPHAMERASIAVSDDEGRTWHKPVMFAWDVRGLVCHSLPVEYARGRFLLTMPFYSNTLLRSDEKLLLRSAAKSAQGKP